jgi:hypothetical protein
MPAAKKRQNPKVGTEFVKEYKGKTYRLRVVRVGNGVGFQLGGEVFTSPSTAGKSITGSELNGWKFWNID